MDAKRWMPGTGPVMGLCLVVLAALLALAPAATAGTARALAALERDIGAAMAHAAVLRERLAAEGEATVLGASGARDIAGIADGGSLSSLAALRLAARAVDRRIETLRAGLAGLPPERAEIMLLMRSALGSVLWTIEDLPLAMAATEESDGVPGRRALLDRLDRSLADLAAATDAMATLAP